LFFIICSFHELFFFSRQAFICQGDCDRKSRPKRHLCQGGERKGASPDALTKWQGGYARKIFALVDQKAQ